MAARQKAKETERLSLRCTKRDKSLIERVAKEKEMSLTQCTIDLYKNAGKSLKRDKNIASAACRIQTLVNYIRDHHIENDYILGECDKIWDELNS